MGRRTDESRLRDRLPDPEDCLHNPSIARLRALAADEETTTEYGAACYVSDQRSRSADRTANPIDDEFTDRDWETIEAALAAAHDRELIALDRRVGRDPAIAHDVRLYVPVAYARIALAIAGLFEPATGEPTVETLQLPDWERTAIRVLPEAGLTVVLGSDYTGEAKKSFLRLFMHRAKQMGGLGLHAGTKRLTVERADELATVGQGFLGLSGTGKSTLTGHGCWLEEPEGTEVLQDDVCALFSDGRVAGSEGRGMYIKTEGLTAGSQPALHRAVTHETAVLENVRVEDGVVDFDDTELTSNGRAVVRREQVSSAAAEIDLDRLDQLFFITRHPVMPPVARLTDRQAAVAFMLGESVETSAGDPDAAGESVRVVGTNPFIVGPEGVEGNRFQELVAAADIETYLLNTGGVGTGADRREIGVEESIKILLAVARDRIEWRYDEQFGLELAESVPGLAIDAYDPTDRVPGFDRRLRELRAERQAYLETFDELDPAIRAAVY